MALRPELDLTGESFPIPASLRPMTDAEVARLLTFRPEVRHGLDAVAAEFGIDLDDHIERGEN